MTTKTDYQAITELQAAYEPKKRHIVTKDEREQIKKVLELDTRTDIELRNVRDMVVLLYDHRIESAREAGDMVEFDKLRDAMSAVTYVIDEIEFERGMEV